MQAKTDDDLRRLIEGAASEGVPLYSHVDRNRVTMRNAKRVIRSAPHGEEFDRLYLRKGAHADLSAAAALMCDLDEVEPLLYEGGVPVIESARFAKDTERCYRTIYARVRRRYGAAAVSSLTSKKGRRPTNFFLINADELAHAG